MRQLKTKCHLVISNQRRLSARKTKLIKYLTFPRAIWNTFNKEFRTNNNYLEMLMIRNQSKASIQVELLKKVSWLLANKRWSSSYSSTLTSQKILIPILITIQTRCPIKLADCNQIVPSNHPTGKFRRTPSKWKKMKMTICKVRMIMITIRQMNIYISKTMQTLTKPKHLNVME